MALNTVLINHTKLTQHITVAAEKAFVRTLVDKKFLNKLGRAKPGQAQAGFDEAFAALISERINKSAQITRDSYTQLLGIIGDTLLKPGFNNIGQSHGVLPNDPAYRGNFAPRYSYAKESTPILSRNGKPKVFRDDNNKPVHLYRETVVKVPVARTAQVSLNGGARTIEITPKQGSDWHPLTKKYRERNPKSVTFWRKQGRLADGFSKVGVPQSHYLSWYTQAIKTLAKVDRYRKFSTTAIVPLSSKTVAARYNLYLPKLHGAIDDIIRTSFITGVPFDTPNPGNMGKAKRNNLYVIRYPEHFRPWIGRFAAKVGDYNRDTLRNLK